LWAVRDGVLGPELTFVNDEAWFHLIGYVSAQTVRAGLVQSKKLHDQVCCQITAAQNILNPTVMVSLLINLLVYSMWHNK